MFLIPIDIDRDDNGTLLITSPMLPEVTTFAESEAEIGRHATDAIEEAIAARVAAWEDTETGGVPASKDTQYVRLPLLSGLKLALFLLCKKEGVSRAELMRRMNTHRNQVDRLFDLSHASKLDQIEEAFAAIGKEVDLEVHDQRERLYA